MDLTELIKEYSVEELEKLHTLVLMRKLKFIRIKYFSSDYYDIEEVEKTYGVLYSNVKRVLSTRENVLTKPEKKAIRQIRFKNKTRKR